MRVSQAVCFFHMEAVYVKSRECRSKGSVKVKSCLSLKKSTVEFVERKCFSFGFAIRASVHRSARNCLVEVELGKRCDPGAIIIIFL